ncbi:5-methyltetrahydropteroyltriglutamate--homocysteine S-methyltransferase [Salibacterium halotolerans]|uniref:Methionine synthase II (Cobalamin-independent) n=1 Tax=Salibacterium halotolerans TaxID=1884432 RepID=A0A1I5XLM3_9BACI|nr:5-methyltetrahydropteroyltriglutamate--homocysteine S-methyltransferase [Salibacterium halotolerans]SFQ32855.1 Methionine synthase II (cobalamin-independent) [Salibacterium halotolerans]
MSITSTKPPFRADHVGSLLRTEPIKDARERFENGDIDKQALRDIEDQEITKIVEKQKEAGIPAVTDGEFRRGWWHYDFLAELDGVEEYEAESGIPFKGVETKARAIRIVGNIDFNEHSMIDDFRFLKSIAGDHEAKMTIPSPSMLHFRTEFAESAYEDLASFFHDLAQAYKKAIQAFYDEGCRYLQLDDTSWSHFCSENHDAEIFGEGVDPEDIKSWYAKTINDAIADRPDDMTITMHICRGNFRSAWIESGGYERVAETIFQKLNVDGLFLEYDTDRAGGFEPLRFVNRSDLYIVLGLVTSKFGELEDPEDVKKRIDEAAEYVNRDQLCLSPQCGFASTEEGNILSEEEQWEKLRHVKRIADDVWGSK